MNEVIIKTFYGFLILFYYIIKLVFYKNYFKYLDQSKNLFQRFADFNIKFWLSNDSNVKIDRASMFSSLEVRSPFLDYRIIEFARSLPKKYRYSKGVKKTYIKRNFKRIYP